MEQIFADKTVSISEFKREMSGVLKQAAGAPVAVLKNNRPDFYVVTPALFEVLMDALDDFSIRDEVLARHKSGKFIDVNINDL